MPVIDFHLHPLKYETYQPGAKGYLESVIGEDIEGYIKRMATPEAVVEMLEESGVDYAVVLAELSPITTGMISNETIAEFCQVSERLIPFANINPYLVTSPPEELERCMKGLGFRGLKLYPTYQHFYPNESAIYPLYAKAEELGIPVMIHTGSSAFRGSRLKYGDPLFIDDLAVDFPDLVLIQVHSGRGFWYDRAFFLARLHENVYMEIAGLPPQKLLTYFPDLERNSAKVLFGSDWPGVKSIKANIEALRALPISEEAKRKILGENAARILGVG
jgi:predicted TIM-barrel fold metal-dependent hydrolase